MHATFNNRCSRHVLQLNYIKYTPFKFHPLYGVYFFPDKVMDQSKEVFSDVVDDFSKLSSIKEHFEGWKFNLSSSYEQAYISLCVPKVFAPYVRLQLLRWNPLTPDSSEQLEDMLWFQVLMFFGFSEGREIDPEDEDLQLIPNLVDLVVIPKLTGRSSKLNLSE